MQVLRNRSLVLFLLMAFSLPQAYSSLHSVCHNHHTACVETDNKHFHEDHPDCQVCDHVLPAIYHVVFSETGLSLNSKITSVTCWYNQLAPVILQDLRLFRGPPAF